MNTTTYPYLQEITVSVSPRDHEHYVDDVKVLLPYDIQVDFRSWGLKDIDVFLPNDFDVTYFERSCEDDNAETEKTLKVDPSQLRREWVSGDGYCPCLMDIYLKADGTIDYELSSITFYYADPSR